MGFKFASFAVFGAALFTVTPALAWSSNTQPATNEIKIWAYPSTKNNCPVGLQPVVVGGAISCGIPTATGYQAYLTPAPNQRYTKFSRAHTHKPDAAYSKSYSENN